MSEQSPSTDTTVAPTEQKPKRRQLAYSSLPAILTDVNQLAAGQVKTTGDWTFPQILQHLARAMNASFDGANFKLNWFIRTVGRLLFKKKVLRDGMQPGVKLPKEAGQLMPDENPGLEEALQEFRQAIGRFETEAPEAAHIFFGPLTPEEWTIFHIRHSELHLSLVWPA